MAAWLATLLTSNFKLLHVAGVQGRGQVLYCTVEIGFFCNYLILGSQTCC